MKKIIFLISLLSFFQVFLYSQPGNTYVVQPSKRFKVNEMFYASSYNGLKTFMGDIQNEKPELYNKLLPEFKAIGYFGLTMPPFSEQMVPL